MQLNMEVTEHHADFQGARSQSELHKPSHSASLYLNFCLHQGHRNPFLEYWCHIQRPGASVVVVLCGTRDLLSFSQMPDNQSTNEPHPRLRFLSAKQKLYLVPVGTQEHGDLGRHRWEREEVVSRELGIEVRKEERPQM